jgi:hypothetical protein
MEIFIAHAREDSRFSQELLMALRGAGHSVFLDSDALSAGSPHHARIQDAIDNSDVFIFLVSPDSVAPGKYTLSELEQAKSRWKNPAGHVIPVMVRGTELDQIDPYLTAVTILTPKGNVAAETLAAVRKLEGATRATGEVFANLGAPGIYDEDPEHGLSLMIVFANNTAHEVVVTEIGFSLMAKDGMQIRLPCSEPRELFPLQLASGGLRSVELRFEVQGPTPYLIVNDVSGLHRVPGRVSIKAVDHLGESRETMLDEYVISIEDGEFVAVQGSETRAMLIPSQE